MSNSTQEHAIVGVFTSHLRAEAAIRALQEDGMEMKKLSIVGKNFQTEEHAVGFYTAGDRMMHWGGQGVFWGSLWGILLGSGLFFIPGIGPIVALGALEGAAVGGTAGVLGAALLNLGVPDDQIVKYETEVKAGKFLVLARGTAGDIEQAHRVLGTSGASPLAAHAIV
jgi:uncharacterized membrane protein